MSTSALLATRSGYAASIGFRPDIQGLRAIAVVMVVLFHSGVGVLSGGYVGVDMFFVISGFLITTHLLESLERDGRIHFASFYAKRARRILPAALLVSTLTLIAAWIWMSPLLLRSVINGAIATALYVPNIYFARTDTDYLSETTPSVYQHYWSLGIEEQFYMFWPALLAVGFWLCRQREARLMLLVAGGTAVSFLTCVEMMHISQSWAFFSLPTRAWELGVGALVAFLLRSRARWLHWRATGLLAWVGLLALVAIALSFDAGTSFPGWIASLPVLAAAAMLIGGAAPGSLNANKILSVAPIQFLGAISYSLYLVHWPLQVIPHAATFAVDPLPLHLRLFLGALSAPVAWLVYRTVERPVIGSRTLRGWRPLWTGVFAAIASFTLVLSSVGVHSASSQAPLAAEKVASQVESVPGPAGTDFVPANLTPSLEAASSDNATVYADGCHRSPAEEDPTGCRVGKDYDAPLVFLFGDSHAASWYPALEQLAMDGKIQLDSNTKSSCYSLDVEQELDDQPYRSCDRWRDGVIARINQVQPDLVILANYDNERGPLVGGNHDLGARWQSALASTIAQISGPEVAVMADVPDQERTPRLCLSKNVMSANDCAIERSKAFQTDLAEAERAAVHATGVHRLDLTEYLCNGSTCPTIIGNTLVYRDSHHLTATYSRQLAMPLWAQIKPLTR